MKSLYIQEKFESSTIHCAYHLSRDERLSACRHGTCNACCMCMCTTIYRTMNDAAMHHMMHCIIVTVGELGSPRRGWFSCLKNCMDYFYFDKKSTPSSIQIQLPFFFFFFKILLFLFFWNYWTRLGQPMMEAQPRSKNTNREARGGTALIIFRLGLIMKKIFEISNFILNFNLVQSSYYFFRKNSVWILVSNFV